MSAVLCFDCGTPMERISARRRSGQITEVFRCSTCQGTHKRITAAAGESMAARKVAQKQLELILQRFESAWRGKWRTKSPLDGWTLKHDGRRKGYLLTGRQGAARYFARDLDDLREAMYEALEVGELTSLMLFAVDEQGNGKLRQVKRAADAVTEAERVIARAAAALDQDDGQPIIRRSAGVTDNPAVAVAATQTRSAPILDNRVNSRSGRIVTDNQYDRVGQPALLLESGDDDRVTNNRDAGAAETSSSADEPPNEPIGRQWFLAGRYKVGDRVIVTGAPELPGEVIDVDRARGRVCVRRPNPRGGSKMTHWITADRIEHVAAAQPPAAPEPMNATARATSRADKTRVNRVVMRDMSKNKTTWIECAECGRQFRAGRADAKTCSARCRKMYSRRDSYVRYHSAALEDAVNRLVEMAKKYPDQRHQIRHTLNDAVRQIMRAQNQITGLLNSFDVPDAL